MTYAPDEDELQRCIDEFGDALEQLAWQLAYRVIADEHARRRGGEPRPARAKARRGAPSRERRAPQPAPSRDEMTAPAGDASAAPGKRVKWTRDTVIAELCEWLISGIVEPAFLRRHGKPGLVPAATRIFGRFDSALNVANLYLAKQYPDGPPKRRPPIAPAVPRKRAPHAPARADISVGAAPDEGAPADAASGAIAPEPAASVEASPEIDPAHVN
jgi:hypothetical protein